MEIGIWKLEGGDMGRKEGRKVVRLELEDEWSGVQVVGYEL